METVTIPTPELMKQAEEFRARWLTCSREVLEGDGKLLAGAIPQVRTPEGREFLQELVESARTIWRARFAPAAQQAADVTPATPAEAATVGEALQPLAPVANLLVGLTFTVEFSGGDYVTLRVVEQETGKLAGKRILQLLTGPDNSSSFIGIGFIANDGTVSIWNRFKDSNGQPRPRMFRCIEAYKIARGGNAGEYTEAYARMSGRCSHCGRKLTVPASLKRGLGPDCAAKLGF